MTPPKVTPLAHKFFLIAILSSSVMLIPPRDAATAAPPPGSVKLEPSDDEAAIVRKAASVTPSPRQVAWQQLEYTAFIHFGMNTFTDKEWGDGTESPALFNPTQLDARQWVRILKDAGMKEIVFTAKHHDGFCLWPSKYTEHSLKNSPWRGGKGDLVREIADAAHEAGIKFGLYLSPWDRHEKTFGTPAYNDYYKNQLRELLTGYGELSEIWMDGACGDGDTRCGNMPYDWDSIFALVRELQPNAVISIHGPDVRYVGNEAGEARANEWSVVPQNINHSAPDLGSRAQLLEAAASGSYIRWYPAQTDTSIRTGWFYHKYDDYAVKPIDKLVDIYFNSVGGNSVLILNVPPDARGLIHQNDEKRLKQLKKYLDATFAKNLAAGAQTPPQAAPTIDGDTNTYWSAPDDRPAELIYDLPQPALFDTAMLQEHIQTGQRIEEFAIDAWDGAQWSQIATAGTVGYKRLLRFKPVTAGRVRIRITKSRVFPTLAEFGLFATPEAGKTK